MPSLISSAKGRRSRSGRGAEECAQGVWCSRSRCCWASAAAAKARQGASGSGGAAGPTRAIRVRRARWGRPAQPVRRGRRASRACRALSIRVVRSDCLNGNCTVQCHDNEVLVTAYCGPDPESRAVSRRARRLLRRRSQPVQCAAGRGLRRCAAIGATLTGGRIARRLPPRHGIRLIPLPRDGAECIIALNSRRFA